MRLPSNLISWLIPFMLIACTDEAEQGKRDWMDKQRAKMVRELKDPDSAKFRDEKLSRDALCGEVNAKNSMGGYTGYKRFIADSLFFVIEDEDVHFYPATDPGEVMRQMDVRIITKRAVSRQGQASDELRRSEFEMLWREFCV